MYKLRKVEHEVNDNTLNVVQNDRKLMTIVLSEN